MRLFLGLASLALIAGGSSVVPNAFGGEEVQKEVAELPGTPVGSAEAEPSEAPVPAAESVIPAAVNERALVTSDGGANSKSLSSKKLEFEDQAINVLDADYGKLDLTAVRESDGTSARLYPIRKSFKREQQEMVKNWGIGE